MLGEAGDVCLVGLNLGAQHSKEEGTQPQSTDKYRDDRPVITTIFDQEGDATNEGDEEKDWPKAGLPFMAMRCCLHYCGTRWEASTRTQVVST